jgi:SAM-dependent methyltransferase
MARLGASEVIGIDVGEKGLSDARRRSQGMSGIRFEHASILDIPFEDETFDMVWCAGVLMMTSDPDRALDELTRVTKHGGYLYLLVLATGGMRWPLIQWLQPLAAQITRPSVERAIDLAGLPANKRRTFLDDLFCPRRDFYFWDRLDRMLKTRGFQSIQRWGPECRLDHEASLESYRQDFEALAALFSAGGSDEFAAARPLFQAGHRAIESTIHSIRWFEAAIEQGEMTSEAAMERVIGQGHHRVLAVRG